MAGAYCRYCGHRCFVERLLPADSKSVWAGRLLPADSKSVWAGSIIHMATCDQGMEWDRKATGYDADTATNPHTKKEAPVGRVYEVRYTVPVELIVEVTADDEDQALDRAYTATEHYLNALPAAPDGVRAMGALDGTAHDSIELVEGEGS